MDNTPRILVEGHEDDVYHAATHPTDPNIFATGAKSGRLRVWDMRKHDVVRAASLGFPIAGLDFSNEPYTSPATGRRSTHLAIGSAGGYNMPDQHRVVVVDAETLQPLKVMTEPTAQVDEVEYSPVGGPGILAVGGRDMTIYLYNANADYQFIAK